MWSLSAEGGWGHRWRSHIFYPRSRLRPPIWSGNCTSGRVEHLAANLTPVVSLSGAVGRASCTVLIHLNVKVTWRSLGQFKSHFLIFKGDIARSYLLNFLSNTVNWFKVIFPQFNLLNAAVHTWMLPQFARADSHFPVRRLCSRKRLVQPSNCTIAGLQARRRIAVLMRYRLAVLLLSGATYTRGFVTNFAQVLTVMCSLS